MNSKRNPVGWFELYVQDILRAKAFYENTFAKTLEKLEMPNLEMFAFPGECGAGGAAGALCKMEGCSSGSGGTIIYFSCEDCALEESRVVPNGGRIFKSKFSIGEHGFIALVYDTEENLIGLHSMN